MAHGTQDYGNVQQKVTTYRLDDMAEAAVRIGAINSIDRLGEVLFIDSFENGIQRWDPVTSGDNPVITLSGARYRTGGFSCKLVAGSTGGAQAAIQTKITYPYLSNFGFEFSFSQGATIDYVTFGFVLYTGATRYFAYCKIDYTNLALKIQSPLVDWATIDDNYVFLDDPFNFHTIKLIVDFINFNYIRLISNEKSYDLSAYPLPSLDSTNARRLFIEVNIHGILTYNSYIYVDDIIITQNEP